MSAIYTNTSALTVFTSYNRNQADLSSSLEKLSTGLKINRGSDDAAGLAISENLRGQIKGTNQAVNNISNATNYINVADGYLQTVNDMLGRMQELAVEAGDATKSAGDVSNIDQEFSALQTEITNVYTQAKYNGATIFDGTQKAFVVDANGNSFSTNAASFKDNSAAIAALATPTQANAGTISSSVATQIGVVSTQRASLGADQSQLNFKSQGLQTYAQNVTAAESNIRDVDVAQETTNFSRDQILVQASTAMLAQANALPQGVLKLLG